MASKTNGKNTSKGNGNGNGNSAPTALETLPDVAGFRQRHSGVISAARLLNDANEKTVGQDPEISLQRSLTVFIRASGVPDGKKLTKEEKAKYEASHKAFCSDYAKTHGITVTVAGQAVDVRVTGERFAGFDKAGLPDTRVRRLEAREALTHGERSGYAADRAAHFQRMAALEEQAAKS